MVVNIKHTENRTSSSVTVHNLEHGKDNFGVGPHQHHDGNMWIPWASSGKFIEVILGDNLKYEIYDQNYTIHARDAQGNLQDLIQVSGNTDVNMYIIDGAIQMTKR